MFGVINFERRGLKRNYEEDNAIDPTRKATMNVEANNNGGATGGNRKYPNEHGYVADQGINLFDGDAFDELSDERISRYNHRHAALASQDYTAYGYAMITPADKLSK